MGCGGTCIILDHKWANFVMYYEIILSKMAKWLLLKGLLGGEVSISNIYT
jgi:hypothetical protein